MKLKKKQQKKSCYYYRLTGLKHISPESMKEQHIQSEVSTHCNLHWDSQLCLHKYTEKHPITCSLALQPRSERIRCVAFWSQCEAYKLHAAQHQYSPPALLGAHKAWSSQAIGHKHASRGGKQAFCSQPDSKTRDEMVGLKATWTRPRLECDELWYHK